MTTAPLLSDRPSWTLDIMAGLTVALVSLPQCLAYAMMSGLPPAYGLVTAAIPGLVAALLGHSAQIITGPTNTTGLLILKTLTPFLAANGLLGPEGLPVLATLTLLAGTLRLIIAWAGGATLLRFIPESVLVGFTAGAGVLIGVMQLDEAFGMKPVKGAGLVEEFQAVGAALSAGDFSFKAFAVAVAVALAIVAGKKWAPRAPVALMTIVATTFAAWLFNWSRAMGVPVVRDRSPLPHGWPEFAMPTYDWAVIEPLLLPAAAITLLGTLELTVSVRAEDGEQKMRREIMAQGWANVAGAFTGAFPASASLTRSALLRLGNAQTRLAGISAALILLPILLFLTELVGYIPQASLAGVLWVTAYSMVKRDRIRRIWNIAWTSRSLLIVTFAATLFLPLELAIFLGVGLGLLAHLRESGAARIRAFALSGDALVPVTLGVNSEATDDVTTDAPTADATTSDVLAIEISGNFHYAAVQQFREEVADQIPEGPRRIYVDLTHAHHARFAAVQTFEQLAESLASRGQALTLCGVSPGFAARLERADTPLEWYPEPTNPEAGCALRKLILDNEAPPRTDDEETTPTPEAPPPPEPSSEDGEPDPCTDRDTQDV